MMTLVQDRWYIVLEADQVGQHPLKARRHGRDLVFWRDATGTVRCTLDRCPHRGASLALGKVVDGEIACPFHGFRFDGSGKCTAIPANGDKPVPDAYRVQAFTVLEAHGFIWLWEGAPQDDPPAPPWFHDFDDPRWRWKPGRFHDVWPTHWTRVVENQLDFTHLPFVHATSIGRFVEAPMEVTVEDDGDYMKTWVTNQQASTIELHAPNLWRNQIGASTYIMAVFVPVDEDHTATYIRYYQRHVPWWGLAHVYGWVMARANRWILNQDRLVVTSQRPKAVTPGIDERLVASDKPIAWFRRWWAQHRPDGDRAAISAD